MKINSIAILILASFLGGLIIFIAGRDNSSGAIEANGSNVSMVSGKQIIEISAKGGYSPRVTIAKAGIATILKVKTQSSFDCSAALSIPSMSYRKNLPFSGITFLITN